MFARVVHIKLKAQNEGELSRAMESQVLPILRKQKGFRDELTLLSSNKNEATAISIWDSKEDAEAYNRAAYPEVLKTMEKLMEGKPAVDNCEVSNCTFHKIAGRGAGTS